MDHLLRMANTPVLTYIEIGLKSDEIEIYPFPIPDLFVGAPVVIAAKYYSNQCPSKIAIRGFNPHGDQETITTKVETRNDLPVEKIFIKLCFIDDVFRILCFIYMVGLYCICMHYFYILFGKYISLKLNNLLI